MWLFQQPYNPEVDDDEDDDMDSDDSVLALTTVVNITERKVKCSQNFQNVCLDNFIGLIKLKKWWSWFKAFDNI